jgi:hypothetical protein
MGNCLGSCYGYAHAYARAQVQAQAQEAEHWRVCYNTTDKTFPRELGPIFRTGRTLLHCPVPEPDIVTAQYSSRCKINTAHTVPYSVPSSLKGTIASVHGTRALRYSAAHHICNPLVFLSQDGQYPNDPQPPSENFQSQGPESLKPFPVLPVNPAAPAVESA